MQEKNEESEAAFRKAIEIRPTDSIAWAGLALLLEKLGRKEEAKEAHDKVEELAFGH
jgi:Flp pilus assembly protein TadD